MSDEILTTTGNGRHPALKALDVLAGTWEISGPGHHGTVTYEWMDGGHFLIQHVDLTQDSQRTTGTEYIGHHPDSDTLRSHYFGSTGDILEYTYELTGNTLTIWFGEPGSPAKYTGTFNDDASSATGAWSWPGGGYESTMTRRR